ncbi:hypothetical protein RI543_004914 [Arxiozyma heterogenica]|uniref:Uncharacterized protein n=1 Tax=Arxiozyma heterogenica TaxID=278026 RepID=A0AAN7VZH6_9SACH|nr:hypothetical protein RI543_004914 [Kazachstania heterogenica]
MSSRYYGTSKNQIKNNSIEHNSFPLIYHQCPFEDRLFHSNTLTTLGPEFRLFQVLHLDIRRYPQTSISGFTAKPSSIFFLQKRTDSLVLKKLLLHNTYSLNIQTIHIQTK